MYQKNNCFCIKWTDIYTLLYYIIKFEYVLEGYILIGSRFLNIYYTGCVIKMPSIFLRSLCKVTLRIREKE